MESFSEHEQKSFYKRAMYMNSKTLLSGNVKLGSACTSVSTSKFLPSQERHQTDLFHTTTSDEGTASIAFGPEKGPPSSQKPLCTS